LFFINLAELCGKLLNGHGFDQKIIPNKLLNDAEYYSKSTVEKFIVARIKLPKIKNINCQLYKTLFHKIDGSLIEIFGGIVFKHIPHKLILFVNQEFCAKIGSGGESIDPVETNHLLGGTEINGSWFFIHVSVVERKIFVYNAKEKLPNNTHQKYIEYRRNILNFCNQNIRVFSILTNSKISKSLC
jgi:hypothetical protein